MNAALQRLTDWAAASDVAVHSLEVRVGGHAIASAGIAPFGVDVPHRMYSVSKSLTALAVLLLADDGVIALDDPITTHFPEWPDVHPLLAETTIDHMLAMTGPHSRTTYIEHESHWLDTYFTVPPTHRPGTLFTYDTSASYTLSALVERLTGSSLLHFLRARLAPLRLFDDARFVTGPEGIGHGGSGLIAAPHDLVVLAELINDRGRVDGAQVIPARIVDQLIEPRSRPGTQTWGAPLRAGYGRQVWLPDERTWMMFGLGGQIVVGIPSRRVAAVLTADATTLTGGDQRLAEALLSALAEIADAPEGVTDAHTAPLAPPTPAHDAAHARPVRGTFRRTAGEDAPAEIAVDIDERGGALRLENGTELRFDTSRPCTTTLQAAPAVVTAGWSGQAVCDVRISVVGDDISSRRLRLVVEPDAREITVMSQGFGPAVTPAWTWRGSYRR